MAGAERDAAVLLHAVDGGEQFACGVCPIPDRRRLQAVIAVTANSAVFAEISQQPHAPAVRRFGQRQERIELAAHHLLEVLAGRALVDHAALVDDVLQAVRHPGVGRQAIASGASGLLVIALDVLGHVQVRDEAHVGFVDAHAEGDRGHHHHAVLAQKAVLVGLPHAGVEPGVIRQRGDAVLLQQPGNLFHAFARLAVDDPGFAFVLAFDEAQQLRRGILLLDDGVSDVGPVEAADELARVLQLQPFQDVLARDRIGGGGQCHARHRGISLVQHRECAVFRAEVVTPLADAMRLVDGEQAELAALVQRIELRQEARRRDALRRRVQQRQLAAHEPLLDGRGLAAGLRRVQELGVHARFVQRADLVVHQRDQGRHHDRDAMSGALSGDRRNLIAQRLAAAGGHQHQRVAAADHVIDDRGLRAAKLLVAEDVVEDGAGRARG